MLRYESIVSIYIDTSCCLVTAPWINGCSWTWTQYLMSWIIIAIKAVHVLHGGSGKITFKCIWGESAPDYTILKNYQCRKTAFQPSFRVSCTAPQFASSPELTPSHSHRTGTRSLIGVDCSFTLTEFEPPVGYVLPPWASAGPHTSSRPPYLA